MPVISLLLMLAAPDQAAAAAAPARACPARWNGLPLRGGAVYDGPPEEMALLKPEDGDDRDDGRSRWPELASIYQAGRQVWLGCAYVEDAMMFVPVTTPVRACCYAERRGVVTLSCR